MLPRKARHLIRAQGTKMLQTIQQMPPISREQTSEKQQKKQRIAQYIKDLCLIQGGEITLASGTQSSVYFNMKRLAADPQAMRFVAQIFLQHITQHPDVKYIGGLEMGAVPLTAAVLAQPEAAQSELRGFYIRKETKRHGLKKLIEGLADESEFKGQKIIILEDVTTTGDSSLEAIRIARKAGADVQEIITLLDREEGAAENLQKENLNLTAIFRASDILSL